MYLRKQPATIVCVEKKSLLNNCRQMTVSLTFESTESFTFSWGNSPTVILSDVTLGNKAPLQFEKVWELVEEDLEGKEVTLYHSYDRTYCYIEI